MRAVERRQAGLTLIELLIALAIGALLLLGVVNVFLSNSQSSRVERALAQVQQSGRAAVDLMSRDIRRAGYSGCSSIGGQVESAVTNLDTQRLLAYRATGTTLLPDPTGTALDLIKGAPRAGTDVLVVDFAEYIGNDLIADGDFFGAVGGTIDLEDQIAPLESGECGLSNGDLVLLSNCLTTHVFRITDATGCPVPNTITIGLGANGGPGAAAGFLYGEGSDVAEYFQFIWYVADTNRDVNGVDVYALYRLESGGNAAAAEEVVQGVEFMRVEVGERIGNNLRYVSPDTVGINWNNVESVRIAMLIQSFEQVTETDDANNYSLLGTDFGAGNHSGGRFVRRVYTTSQAIRNTNYGT